MPDICLAHNVLNTTANVHIVMYGIVFTWTQGLYIGCIDSTCIIFARAAPFRYCNIDNVSKLNLVFPKKFSSDKWDQIWNDKQPLMVGITIKPIVNSLEQKYHTRV